MVLFHIIFAVIGIGLSIFLLVAPSKPRLRTMYAVTGITIASGTYLVWQKHTHILQACVTGLLYLGFVSASIISAHTKLAASSVKHNEE